MKEDKEDPDKKDFKLNYPDKKIIDINRTVYLVYVIFLTLEKIYIN